MGSAITKAPAGSPAVLYALPASVGNPANTTDTTAWTYTLPAGKLAKNGDELEIDAVFTTAANANNKTIRVYFGAQTPLAYVAGPANNNIFRWRIRIARTSATSQRVTIDRPNGTVAGAMAYYMDTATWTETLGSAIVIKGTVQSPTTGAENDAVAVRASITYFPAP